MINKDNEVWEDDIDGSILAYVDGFNTSAIASPYSVNRPIVWRSEHDMHLACAAPEMYRALRAIVALDDAARAELQALGVEPEESEPIVTAKELLERLKPTNGNCFPLAFPLC